MYIIVRRDAYQQRMHFCIRTWRMDDCAITHACVAAVIVSPAVAPCLLMTLNPATCSRLNHTSSRNCHPYHASEVILVVTNIALLYPVYTARPDATKLSRHVMSGSVNWASCSLQTFGFSNLHRWHDVTEQFCRVVFDGVNGVPY